jgi:hypothetical protein
MRTQNTMNIAARVMRAQTQWEAELVLVDDTGHWGHGVIDALNTANYPAVGINYSERAIDPRYKNRRAEMWLEGAKAIKKRRGAAESARGDRRVHRADLHLRRRRVLARRKGSDQGAARRLARRCRAYMLTYALPDMPGAMRQALGQAQHVRTGDSVDQVLHSGAGRALTGDDVE